MLNQSTCSVRQALVVNARRSFAVFQGYGLKCHPLKMIFLFHLRSPPFISGYSDHFITIFLSDGLKAEDSGSLFVTSVSTPYRNETELSLHVFFFVFFFTLHFPLSFITSVKSLFVTQVLVRDARERERVSKDKWNAPQ